MLKCQMSCNKSAWWSFASVTDRQRLQVLLQHDIRSGLCSPETCTTLTSLAESIDDAADALFQRIMHNPCHVPMSYTTCSLNGANLYRARQKSNPLGKSRYLWNCSKFYLQINSAYRWGFRPHILQISLQYFLAFQNYNYLNLNVHFSKCTSN